MTRVLVVWEDDYFEALGRVLECLVRAGAPAPEIEMPKVHSRTARSNGGFDHFVHTSWGNVRSRGVALDPSFIDHLLCVVDGDRLRDLLPASIPHPPPGADGVPAWHTAAERAWQTHLRAKCDPGGPPVTTVHGAVLRWSKESLVLAGYDQPAMAAHIDVSADHPDVAARLATCNPRPHAVKDERFTDTFRRPQACLDLMREARGLGKLHKSSSEIDDALRALARDSLPKLRDRVPDLALIAARIWNLHQGAPTPATPLRDPAADAGRRKPRKRTGQPPR